MSALRARAAALALVAGLSLSACAYDGRGGVSAGYASSYYGPYHASAYDPWYGPGWGWYRGYYYPGRGIYVYDRRHRPHRWSAAQRRAWFARRSNAGRAAVPPDPGPRPASAMRVRPGAIRGTGRPVIQNRGGRLGALRPVVVPGRRN